LTTTPTWRETLEADPLGLAGRRGDDHTPAPAGRSRTDLLRLAVIVAAIVALGFASGYGETILLLLVLVGCIVAHEFGHYIAARTGGVKVTEFFVGFGPRLWSVRRGETEYGVKAIPLGGYCRIIGMNNLEEVDPADERRTYRHAPLWRRLLIDVAGSTMHFVIALFLLFAMFFWTGDQGYYLSAVPADNPIATILTFQNGPSPAQTAGFRLGDRIESIDGVHFADGDALTTYIRHHPGTRLDFSVLRAGHLVVLHATPVLADTVKTATPSNLPTGAVGVVGFGLSSTVHSGFGSSVARAGGAFGYVASGTLHALGHLVSFSGLSGYVHMISSQKAAATSNDRLTTVIGLPSVLHQAGQSGLPAVLWLLALINISIGLFNLAPLFPLDGGRVVVALYEGVRSIRRPYRVDTAKILPIMYAGLAIIAFFALGSMFIDLRSVSS
jgi:membrane-associated protease RseP (regulator of RpoE activity)